MKTNGLTQSLWMPVLLNARERRAREKEQAAQETTNPALVALHRGNAAAIRQGSADDFLTGNYLGEGGVVNRGRERDFHAPILVNGQPIVRDEW